MSAAPENVILRVLLPVEVRIASKLCALAVEICAETGERAVMRQSGQYLEFLAGFSAWPKRTVFLRTTTKSSRGAAQP